MSRISLSFFALTSVLLLLLSGCGQKDQASAATQKDAEKNIVDISMTAKQYEFVPGTAEPIRVKRGDTVRIRAVATDVPHGIALPDYDITVGLPVNEEKTFEFVADKPGTFTFFCSVYCGEGHGRMKGTLIVEAG